MEFKLEDEITEEIERLIGELRVAGNISQKDYSEKLEVIDKLVALRKKVETEEPDSKFSATLKTFISNPALLNLVGGMMATLLVLYFERTEVITSKAFNWIKFK